MRILVASGKGGAGKTTVVAGLADVWQGPLIAIDCDVEAPNLALFLKPTFEKKEDIFLEVPKIDASKCEGCLTPNACTDICHYKAIVRLAGKIHTFTDMCHGCGGCMAVCYLDALTPDHRLLGAVETGTFGQNGAQFLMGKTRIGEAMTPPLIRALRREMKTRLEAQTADVLLDSPPGISCPTMSALEGANGAILVAEPTPFGEHDFYLAFEGFARAKTRIAVVLNRTGIEGSETIEARIRAFCHEKDIPILGELPFETNAACAYAKTDILTHLSPEWKARFVAIEKAMKVYFAQGDDNA